ncbi:hypothetical protein BHE74_00042259 [Ensete ventricosum]|nr:hypothetical protein BHE74_00042259 [Ensete ventricosum]
MVCTIPASAWTWLVRPRKASTVTMSGAGFDAGEGNPESVSSSKSDWESAQLPWPPPSVEGGQSSAWEVGYRNDGAQVGRKCSSSGRVGSRRDPSDSQVSFVIGSSIPLPRRGARAYIVGIVDHPYLVTRLPLWLTLPSYTSTTPVVLAVRDVSTGEGISLTCVRSIVSALPMSGRSYNCWGIGLTCVRPAVRPLAPSYLRPTGLPCWVDHVSGPVVRGSDDMTMM